MICPQIRSPDEFQFGTNICLNADGGAPQQRSMRYLCL